MIFELLLGKHPFASSSDDIVQKKASPTYDVLTEAAGSGLDPQTQAFLRRALAFDPSDRFGDADDMANSFDLLPLFVGLAAAYGEEVELDPEKLRLKRMEEQGQAERRKLDEDKRRLEQDRQQLASQPVAHQLMPALQGAPLAQPSQGGSKAGMLIGVAGGALLVGIGLIVGKAYLSAKAEQTTAPPQGVVVVDVVPAVPAAAPAVEAAKVAEPAPEPPPEPSAKPKKEVHSEAKPAPGKPPAVDRGDAPPPWMNK